MNVDPSVIKNILVNKLVKYRSLKLPPGTLVRIHESMLTSAIDSIYVQEQRIQDAETRIQALEKENTHLTLLGFRRNEAGEMERIDSEEGPFSDRVALRD